MAAVALVWGQVVNAGKAIRRIEPRGSTRTLACGQGGRVLAFAHPDLTIDDAVEVLRRLVSTALPPPAVAAISAAPSRTPDRR